ncbi:hypothetical protein [Pedobacter flavus]|uniref:DUF3299 domain-containing protein n=1 Tax=Pedobacter flavus TaxID=3113906 RepID=A0ABU7H1T4_9SPHI|nr:hypothetical protein [Pedobacter sp. VNH31]MEE1885277.1 hypothetical protein [Pedobacter sp. VNH31]
MKKIFYLLLVFLGIGITANAQHNPDDLISSDNWNIIGTVDFRTPKETEMYAIFGSEIKKHENKPFELEGYIVPIKDGMQQTKFMLATLPINQCFYCGKDGIPIMVMVEMAKPIKFTYQTVKIKGNLKLFTGNSMDNPPITLTNSVLVN